MEAESPYPDEVLLSLPPPLISLLEKDCHQICQQGKVVQLPRQPNVETVLKEYYDQCVSGATEDVNLQLLIEVLDGIKVYFDFMLEDHLLYAEEQQQYREMVAMSRKPGKGGGGGRGGSSLGKGKGYKEVVLGTPPSTVYGLEHLIRLFVKMPLFLSRAKFPSSHINLLHQYFKDLLGYLCSRREELLKDRKFITSPSNTEDTVS